ncbi:ArsR/SmtB family transcription factor [Aestuariimicrobium ganziense]|uniref:ArsR/SmtB family transcription factor n=1 Tax=Aestuariimicrobium ganziense TaxID=2773677 RepID=UPI00194083F2|nr:metalloregulator ArsR/SmtB family transcription factor [Aestuariimicrobium ganziense]
MNSFAVLADPVRRRIVELLCEGERSAGEIGAVVMPTFGIGQPAVSNQLRLLREGEVVRVEARGSHRIYSLEPGALDDVQTWVERYSALWSQRLDALGAELARAARQAAPHDRPTSDRKAGSTHE